jgi:hypothetical protein
LQLRVRADRYCRVQYRLKGWIFSAGPSPSDERIGSIPLAPKKNRASQKRLSAVDPPPRVNRA